MICRQCGRTMPDSARFCPGCGAPMNQQLAFSYSRLRYKNRQKKIILITVSCLCLLAAGITAGVFLMKKAGSSSETYAETIASAERYLLEQDYDRAEEFYARAIEIAPKESAPYEKLYEIYTVTEQEEKAEEIAKKAQTVLEEGQQTVFAQKKEEIQEVYQPVNRYTIVKELGDLQMVPVSINDEVWIIKRNDTYSLMDSQGETVSDYPTEAAAVFFRKTLPTEEPTDTDRVMLACLAANYDFTADGNQWPVSDNNEMLTSLCPVYDMPLPEASYVLSADNEPVLSAESQQNYDKVNMTAPQLTHPAFLKKENDTSGQVYAWNPADHSVIGPYEKEDIIGFGHLLLKEPGLNLHDLGAVQEGSLLFSPFWSRQQKEGKTEYTVYSWDGKESRTGYDSVLVTDADSIGVFEKGRFTLLDENLQPMYTGRFEAGARAHNGVAPVKTGGTWKLVRLGDPVRARDYTGENPLEKVPAAEPEKAERTDQNLSEEDAALLRSVAGEYALSSNGLGFEQYMLHVTEDGSFTAVFDLRKEDGTLGRHKAEGRFEVVPPSPQTYYRYVRIAEVSLEQEDSPEAAEILQQAGLTTEPKWDISPAGMEQYKVGGWISKALNTSDFEEGVLQSTCLSSLDVHLVLRMMKVREPIFSDRTEGA